MNVRDFREEVAEAFLRGFELALKPPPSLDLIKKAERIPGDGPQNLLMNAAQSYARSRVIENATKLEPMT